MVPASDESPRPHAIPLHDSPTSAMVNYIRAPPRVRERAVYYCRSSGVGSRETPTIRTSKATRRRSTTMSAVKREAMKLLEIACPYHDDIAITDRSQKLRRRGRKAHDHPIERATKDCSSM